MAKMTGTTPNFGEKMKLAREAKQLTPKAADVSENIAPIEVPTDVVVPKEVVEQKAPKQESSIDLKAILARMERQDEEIAALKVKEEDRFIKKEKYKGPRHYKFSLRGGVPVLNKTQFLKDPTKPLLYQNDAKQYISNQYLRLTLADGTTPEVENNMFGRDKQMTDPLPCALSIDEEGNTLYIFTTPDFGKITVLSSCIN